ncbi:MULTISPECIES: hypothetical protein [Allobranchiibius]|uniref:Uncharacterized membrane protein YidH (DUF202 family) n=1 Tax=Allobranchiibius huperziae TaxID=1874116 RepID=A0A853DK30_9MICO|nr:MULTISPECIES: hypothetical protein [Allobranchiibius]MBO1766293.1 hypothetical protein [Allobranchiibius sp. GilTou38]NYJ74515.1 uncharacterized membrane protein YidH (DUF202 family) [Allobranchiibius huperziae]
MAQTTTAPAHRRAAGLFDVRNIIAALFAIYGVVLTIMGAFNYTDSDSHKTGGVNLNLWSGLAMILVAVLMALWAGLRPIIVPVEDESADKSTAPKEF